MKTLLKYIIILCSLGIISLLLLDKLFLPLFINTNEEIYIPDVRDLSTYKAEKELTELGFSVEIITSNYNSKYIPNTVIEMSPRAFTKIKKGRTIKLTISGDKKKHYC